MIFHKYHGTGNDFIIIDNRDKTIQLAEKTVAQLCARHFGIGADGLILIEPHDDADFYMRYYNSDGKLSTMCGNGGRCAVLFAKHASIINGNTTTFFGADGAHEAIFQENGIISLKMNVSDEPEIVGSAYVIDTGSPHFVRFTYNVENIDVKKEGRIVRNSASFKKEGVNVNFVEENSSESIYVRTYERGVEDETLSCGTGVTASAICQYHKQRLRGNKTIQVETLGGLLSVTINGSDFRSIDSVWLNGSAKAVFIGEISI